MKIIDKKNLKQLIDDLIISDFHVEEPIESIDLSNLAEIKHEHRRDGFVKLIIEGRVSKPSTEL